MTAPDGSLAGIRVLEVANFLAAPIAGMFLADHGAEVIKVERPGTGDEIRSWGYAKDGVGLFHKVVNRNKKSITLDLHEPTAQQAVRDLARTADVVLENFRPGTLEGWGLGYSDLAAVNERIVYTSISGFGRTGPYAHRRGFGTLAEGFSGFAQVTGDADGAPLLPGFGLADSTTGLTAAYLTMVALRSRDAHGHGQHVDLGLYESLFTLIGSHVIDHDQLGVVQHRDGSRLPFASPRNTFRTSDGQYLVLAGSSQGAFERICRALGCPALIGDPRFATNRDRLANVVALESALQEAVGRFTLDEALRVCHEGHATAEAVYDVERIMDDPHYRERGNVVTVADHELGPVRMQNVVGVLSRTPGRITHSAPPLGAHNEEILSGELGLDPEGL
ncbi:CoA transferase [Pseudonocardia nematodicida]|uniref:CoA transferase n=1 Tax=Pseudonocardia nematodicida TaxID=1206997 RepID=A0ABV1KK67_9PSEU